MRFLFALLVCFLTLCLQAQVTIRIVSIPSNTPANATFYLAGSLNNWNPADTHFVFTKTGNTYELNLPAAVGTVQYKITRGSWPTCEGTATGGQSGNRTFTYAPNLVVEIAIAGWENLGGGVSTALPNVKLFTIYAPQLQTVKTVAVYTPSHYQLDSTKHYPVLYMQDGQNIFDAATAFSGEWGVDETLASKEQQGIESCIVVAIYNGGSARLDEYSPYVNPQYGGGKGEAYLDFLVHTLKPHIDSAYRTLTDQQHTGIAGSSMGGLISVYAAIAQPSVFGKVGVFSPALWFSDSLFLLASNTNQTHDVKWYWVAGLNESATMVSKMDTLIATLINKGHKPWLIKKTIKADGAHSEWFWKREFSACYDWLFVNTLTTAKQIANVQSPLLAIPNPARDTFCINQSALFIELIDQRGKVVKTWKDISALQPLSVMWVPEARYVLRIYQANEMSTIPFQVSAH
ncbi:MAG: alpha/beta hydrolase-fold protein [Bacteroidia bacterium]|jgi:metallo-beta-lactamase class B|nr:alpha/beta hydrolase-fold protein [Bacteroidia bacterium]